MTDRKATGEQNAETVGKNACRAGHLISANPYTFPHPSPEMRRLAAAWDRGWKEAHSTDWNLYPMAGRK